MKLNYKIHNINQKLQSGEEISRLADITLRRANAIGKLPTPINEIISASKVNELFSFEELKDGFASTLKKSFRNIFETAIQKVKGIADLRERAIYIPNSDDRLSIFPKAHDLGHQVIPWHNVNMGYLDDEATLSSEIEDQFEQEANFFASEIIFQGNVFKKHARAYTASIGAVLKLSQDFGASIQSTIWKYAEAQDEALAVAMYYPNGHGGKDTGLRLWKIIPSAKFLKKYSEIEIPEFIAPEHPWASARQLKYLSEDEIFEGKQKLNCNGYKYTFEWQAFWNTYALFVSLRRVPALSIISRR